MQRDVYLEAGGGRGGEDVSEVERDDVGGHEIGLRDPFWEIGGPECDG